MNMTQFDAALPEGLRLNTILIFFSSPCMLYCPSFFTREICVAFPEESQTRQSGATQCHQSAPPTETCAGQTRKASRVHGTVSVTLWLPGERPLWRSVVPPPSPTFNTHGCPFLWQCQTLTCSFHLPRRLSTLTAVLSFGNARP